MAIATREAAPSHLLFKIESFSTLDECDEGNYESPEFHAGNFKWRLVIYPNGHGTKNPGEYVSVYLSISGTDSLTENWEVNAVFSIFILNQISGNYHHTIGNYRRFFGLKTAWGVSKFMPKKEIVSPSKGYLLDDCFLFGAEVFVISDINVVTRCSLSFKDVRVPYMHTYKISNFSTLKDECWFSEEFVVGGYKWKIKLYPNGYGDEIGRSISIYLVHVASNNRTTTNERVKARFTCCLMNQLNHDNDLIEFGSNWFDASNEDCGFSDFVSLTKLNDREGGYIVNDTCILEIGVSVPAVAQ